MKSFRDGYLFFFSGALSVIAIDLLGGQHWAFAASILALSFVLWCLASERMGKPQPRGWCPECGNSAPFWKK